MTILADMNSIFTNVLLVVHVAVCLLLCLLVLMQRPKQEGLGAAFGGGMTDQAFGARTTDVLQKGTVYLGTLLFIITLSLAVLVSAKSKSSNMDKKMEQTNKEQVEKAELPSAEDADKDNDAVNPTPAEGDKPEVTPAPAPAEGDKPEATPAPAPAEGDKSEAATPPASAPVPAEETTEQP